MKRFLPFVSTVCVFGILFAQVTTPDYPFPKPMPTVGAPPTQLSEISQTFAPTAYNNPQPVVWAQHVGGGLQSRMNLADRMAIQYPVEGSLVYDASDQTYYGVGTNLIPEIPLWRLSDGFWFNDRSIYTHDGSVTGRRTVFGQGHPLTFTNFNLFEVRSVLTNILSGSTEFQIRTPKINALLATNGMVLGLVNSNIGLVEFVSPPSTFSTNIYNTSGTIASQRTVELEDKSLTFNSTNAAAQFNVNAGLVSINSTSLPLTLSSGGLNLAINSATNVGYVLTLDNTTTKAAKFLPIPVQTGAFDSSIYNTNGTIADTLRTVTYGANELRFNGATGGKFQVLSGDFIGYSSKTNSMFAIDEAIWGASAPLGRLKISSPRSGAGLLNGDSLQMVDTTTGRVDFYPQNNLYNSNGIISSDRIVNSNFRELSFTNNNMFWTRGRTNTLDASLKFQLRTPIVNNGLGVQYQLLALLNKDTGESDFITLGEANIYTKNGSLTASRFVDLDSKTLTFDGPGYFTTAQDLTGVSLGGTNITLYSPTANNGTIAISGSVVSVGAGTQFQLQGPKGAIARNPGDVWTLQTSAAGLSDWNTPTNFYFENAALVSNRTVEGAGKFLSLTNLSAATVSSTSTTLRGNAINLVTTNISTGNASLNQVFTLLNTSTGEGGWRNPQLPPTGVNIYTGDGTLTGLRTLQSGGVGNHLNFFGSVATTGLPAEYVHYYGWDRFICNNRTNEFHGYTFFVNVNAGGKYVLSTARVKTLGAPAMAGQILTLAADGTSDFQAFTPSGVDVNIYSTDGTNSSARTLYGNNLDLTFRGVANRYEYANVLTMQGTNGVRVKTPLFATRQGQFLQLTDQTTGAVEYSTPTDTSIYTINGAIPGSTTRQITIPSSSTLQFIGAGSYDFSVTGAGHAGIGSGVTGYTAIGGTTTFLGGIGTLYLNTPEVYKATKLLPGYVLSLVSTNGAVEYSALPMDTSIYSTNGSILGPRIVSLNNQSLQFNGPGTFQVGGASTVTLASTGVAGISATGVNTISGAGGLFLKTKNQNGTGTSAGQLMTLQADGTAEWVSGTTGTGKNIYNWSDSLTGDRVVEGAGNDLTIQGVDVMILNANHNRQYGNYSTVQGTLGLFVNPPNIGTATFGQVLTLMSPDKSASWQPLPAAGANLYTGNGTILTDRDITGNSKYVRWNNVKEFSVTATEAITFRAPSTLIKGGTSLYIQTPLAGNNQATPGYVLMTETTDGKAEWKALPSSANTIYTGNGDINGARSVNMVNASSVSFTGGAGSTFIANTDNVLMQAPSAAVMTAPTAIFGTSSSVGMTRIHTPLAHGLGAAAPYVGRFLQLIGNDGQTEWGVPATVNIGNTSLTIPAVPRTLTITSGGSLNINGGTVSGVTSHLGVSETGVDAVATGQLWLQGKGGTLLRTRNWTTQTPANYVLKLVNPTTGEAEWAQESTGTGSTGSTEYYAEIALGIKDGNNIYQAGINGGVITPPFTGVPTDRSRWIFRFVSASGYDGSPIQLTVDGVKYSLYRSGQMSGGTSFPIAEIRVGALLEMIVMPSGYPPNTNNKAFMSLNTGWNNTGVYIFVGSSTATGTGAAGYNITIPTANISPPWPEGGPYLEGMRVSTQVTSGISTPNAANAANKFGIGTSGLYPIFGADGIALHANDLVDKVTLDLVWTVRNQAELGWLMVNSNWRSSAHTPGALSATGLGVTPLAGNLIPPPHTVIGGFEVDSVLAPGKYKFRFGTSSPFDLSSYNNGLRIVGTFAPGAEVGTFSNAQVEQLVQVSTGPSVQMLAADGTYLAANTIFNGADLEFAYMSNIRSATTGANMGPAFVLINVSGTKTTEVATAVTTSNVTVTFAGVVDTFVDLATVPLSFKKVSTLGFAQAGDGHHGDYFLTAYDEMVNPQFAMRSSIDPVKMWKRLTVRP